MSRIHRTFTRRAFGTRTLVTIASALVLASVACRTGRNYEGVGPRYARLPAIPENAPVATTDTLCVVTFNVELGERPDSAIAALRAAALPRTIDVLLLQEVDDAAARRVADALNLGYVYYPAIYRNRTSRDFGNAVLTRWPIIEDAKIILPHRSWYGRSQRIAAAATIRVGDAAVRVYSTHLGTPADVTPAQRGDQVRAIVADAAPYAYVILGGDFNWSTTARVAEQAGFVWATRHGPKTTTGGRWDHILFKGMTSPATRGSGTVMDGHGTGDHLAVWAVGVQTRVVR